MTWKKSTTIRWFEIFLLSIAGVMLVFFAAGVGTTLRRPTDLDDWINTFLSGCFLGVVVSPLMVVALRWRPLGRSFALILPPAMMAGLLFGYLGGSGEPLLTMLTVVMMAGLAHEWLPDIRTTPDPNMCAKCGYSLKELPHRRCPECGHVEETRKS